MINLSKSAAFFPSIRAVFTIFLRRGLLRFKKRYFKASFIKIAGFSEENQKPELDMRYHSFSGCIQGHKNEANLRRKCLRFQRDRLN
jgi:hypothetical protein